jgi:hypothetical protein
MEPTDLYHAPKSIRIHIRIDVNRGGSSSDTVVSERLTSHHVTIKWQSQDTVVIPEASCKLMGKARLISPKSCAFGPTANRTPSVHDALYEHLG